MKPLRDQLYGTYLGRFAIAVGFGAAVYFITGNAILGVVAAAVPNALILGLRRK